MTEFLAGADPSSSFSPTVGESHCLGISQTAPARRLGGGGCINAGAAPPESPDMPWRLLRNYFFLFEPGTALGGGLALVFGSALLGPRGSDFLSSAMPP